MSENAIDPRLVEQTRQQIRQLVQEINHIAGSDIPPQQFYGEFLVRVVKAVAAVGGAVWGREGSSPIRLQHQVDFQPSGLLDEAASSNGHSALLMNAFAAGAPTFVPPHSGPGGVPTKDSGSNSSDWSLILAPLRVDKNTVGVVELLMDPNRRANALENAVRFVSELCDIGSGYLKNRQLRQMLNQQHLWSQLESFVREIHSSLTPKEVAYIIASEGKRLVACDRLSVAIVYGRKTVIEAVSGQEVIERKSTLVQTLRRLCNAVIQSKENLLYTGEDIEDLPPAVHDALDEYLAESGTKVLNITLLLKPRKEGSEIDVPEPFGALIGEHLQDATTATGIGPRMDVVAQHAAISLQNALKHNRVFLLPAMSFIGNATEWMRGNRLAKAAIAVGGVAAITAAMIYVPWELRMGGKGKLEPEVRRPVYAMEDGKIQKVFVQHGQIVQKGQLVAQARSDLLEQQHEDTRTRLSAARANYDTYLGMHNAGNKEAGVQMQVAQAEVQSYEAQLKLAKIRISNLQVFAPTDGMIATWDPQRTLESRPVKQGDALLTISQLENDKVCEHGQNASWILEVKIPEHKIGHILKAEGRRREEKETKPLTAWFILANHPQKEFRGHVEKIETTANLDQDDKEHVVIVRIVPDDVASVKAKLAPLADNDDEQQVMHVELTFKDGTQVLLNPGAEVRAKVDCGKRSLGYVLLRELIEFVYETVIF